MPKKHANFLVGRYASIETVMILYKKMSFKFYASSNCLLQMFRCKFIILLYDDGA